jgi:hypothetical protein
MEAFMQNITNMLYNIFITLGKSIEVHYFYTEI